MAADCEGGSDRPLAKEPLLKGSQSLARDPAFGCAEPPHGTTSLPSVRISPDSVYVFDFDGVISSSTEDDIYHLRSWPDEDNLLSKAAAFFDLRCQAMEINYQRHLLYQASALRLGIDIETGPAINQVMEASAISPLFILTARSGWYAVERMRNFLRRRNIIPIEIYNVGRVTKDRQIDLLCREFYTRKVCYIEDNPVHLATAGALKQPNLELILARRTDRRPPEILRRLFIETVEAAIGRTMALRRA